MASSLTRNILVLENEPMIQLLLEDMLADLGFSDVTLTGSVKHARDALTTINPVFAFLDVNLAGETSYEIAAILKDRNIPFIFLSGYANPKLDPAFTNAKTLLKPFQASSLKAALQNALPHLIEN